MPRGTPKPVPPPASPAPMILIEPAAEGIRFNAYGLDTAGIVDALRRSLLHLVAQQSGMEVIALDIPARAAVVAFKAPPKPSQNGKRPRRDPQDDDIATELARETWE